MGSPYVMEPVNTFPDYEQILTSENRLWVIWNSESLKCSCCISALLPTVSFNLPSCELIGDPHATDIICFQNWKISSEMHHQLTDTVFDVVAIEMFWVPMFVLSFIASKFCY